MRHDPQGSSNLKENKPLLSPSTGGSARCQQLYLYLAFLNVSPKAWLCQGRIHPPQAQVLHNLNRYREGSYPMRQYPISIREVTPISRMSRIGGKGQPKAIKRGSQPELEKLISLCHTTFREVNFPHLQRKSEEKTISQDSISLH